MRSLPFHYFVFSSNSLNSKNSPIRYNFEICRLKMLVYVLIFLIFSLSCMKQAIAQLPSTQKHPQTVRIKSASIGTYYVSPTGSNSNPGSESRPFLTAAYAASKANPGDIVIFENGIYNTTAGNFFASLSRSGSSSAYITYKARNKGRAILDGQSNSALGAFTISGSYINISGFEIRGMSAIAIEVRTGASYINFSDLNIHHIGRWCYLLENGQCAFYLLSSRNVTIERCSIHDIGRFAPAENGCSQPKIFYQTLDHGIYVDGSSHLSIQNNLFYNIRRGFALHIYSGSGLTSSDISFINNTCVNGNPYQNAGHVILWGSLNNALIANNIFKEQHSYAIQIYQGSYNYSNVTIMNNITSGGKGIISVGSAMGVTVRNNYNFTDPLFTNEKIHDYSLRRNSPAIKAGYDTGLYTDYLNNARESINIGAY